MKGIFIVGAGPAGLFAARQIALAGYNAFLFNRDIKPGGLAEYGIYPQKAKMRWGLEKQFAQILAMPNIYYFGGIQVGTAYDLSIAELEVMRPAAIVFACGAQGTKKLGIPGEGTKGVYAAKDFVYHYNRLPPFASMDFSTGRRTAVVGVGNVAIDIARWLLDDSPGTQTEQVLILARRGPLEVKFDEKEIEHVERHIARDDLVAELARVRERCARCEQDVAPERFFEKHLRHLKSLSNESVAPRLCFRFLSSPREVLADETGRAAALVVTENDLVRNDDGRIVARATNETQIIATDTVIFAIGDRHDPALGLPMGPEGYATRPGSGPDSEPSYEVWDAASQCVMPGRYVVGWARQASTGLVGVARHDAERGAGKVLEFVRNMPDTETLREQEIRAQLDRKGLYPVTKSDLLLLHEAEQREAGRCGCGSFKYPDNGSMLRAIAEERARTREESCLAEIA